MLIENIKRGEGTKEYQRHIGTFRDGLFHPYKDTLGYWTIGYGHLIPSPIKPITEAQADSFLLEDINTARESAIRIHGVVFNKAPIEIQNLLIEMLFQLGEAKAMKFKRFNAAIAERDYQTAAKELVSSLWYKQTPNRVKGHIETLIHTR